jgi:hypothetical protein
MGFMFSDDDPKPKPPPLQIVMTTCKGCVKEVYPGLVDLEGRCYKCRGVRSRDKIEFFRRLSKKLRRAKR